MAQTPEVKVKARVRAILDVLGIYYFMPPANGYGRQGIPDIICCMAGRFVAIECKAGKGQLTELQKRELDKIMNADGLTYVAREDNLVELKAMLQEEIAPTRKHLTIKRIPAPLGTVYKSQDEIIAEEGLDVLHRRKT
jgi:hypothetical protein